ncbi:TetR family transcriptional regulator [Planotetraspora sp. A-T 1434]|uniref:TetR/AcrR family transcriptional regulator n=1 Tax=Planotetraspora sp. A-T 1434 TaxID=2979219 RepID=UPI0021BE51B7|nr:TetR family transcriptional regulator [Planotetraspora sp. A-T 1434]MCT9929734.1 TetR family transcriptional regulator [Planotetraspora sp. A-T 1434]
MTPGVDADGRTAESPAAADDKPVRKRRRPGRRPGTADTRGEILAAARKVFAEKGFDRATVRGIAREAGVDPALVHHYFDTKEGMFIAAMRLPVDPGTVIPAILAGPREEIGERLVRHILAMTADPEAREPVVGLLRTAMVNEQAVAMIREFLTRAVLGRVAEALQIPPIRMEVAFSQMFGVVMMRYILKLEPLASADTEELVEILSPTIQRYLGG